MPPYEGRRRRLRYHLCSRWWSLHRHSLQTTPRTRRGHGWRRCLAWWAGLWNDAALTSSGRGPRRRRLAQRRGVSRGGAHGRHRQQRRRLRGDGQSRRGHGRCCRRWRRLGGDRALRQGRRRLLGWHSHSKTRGCLDRRWLLRRHHSRRRRHRRRRRWRLLRRLHPGGTATDTGTARGRFDRRPCGLAGGLRHRCLKRRLERLVQVPERCRRGLDGRPLRWQLQHSPNGRRRLGWHIAAAARRCRRRQLPCRRKHLCRRLAAAGGGSGCWRSLRRKGLLAPWQQWRWRL
mmetsp:Transcript_726/g.2782  ORF Transcript_726/g.2782 Transcript_726/m.2782 type:complete len:289 (+) Transcript_726:942-1808(+)